MPENPMTGADARDATRPGTRSFDITPADGADLPVGTRWIYVGGAGDVKVSLVDDPAAHAGITLKAVPAGSFLRVAARRVYLTGTTATLLVGLA